jgi:hypothetical protein
MNERDALRKAFRENPKMANELRKLYEQGKLKVASPEDDGEPLVIICKRWPGLVDDCTMALCSTCGAEVALAPSSRDMIANRPDATFCCMECFQEGKLEDKEKKPEKPFNPFIRS